MTNICSKCGLEKTMPRSPSEFARGWKAPRCGPCTRAKQKQRERTPAYMAVKAQYRAANPERIRAGVKCAQLRRLYGITLAEFDAMVQAQGGACAICGDTTKRLCVDHDHTTGKVRQILCNLCNVTLGSLEDADWMRRAAAYLEAHSSSSAALASPASCSPSASASSGSSSSAMITNGTQRQL